MILTQRLQSDFLRTSVTQMNRFKLVEPNLAVFNGVYIRLFRHIFFWPLYLVRNRGYLPKSRVKRHAIFPVWPLCGKRRDLFRNGIPRFYIAISQTFSTMLHICRLFLFLLFISAFVANVKCRRRTSKGERRRKNQEIVNANVTSKESQRQQRCE